MTTLATHTDPDQLDMLALIADPWTPTRAEFADIFRTCCRAEADAHDGWINPSAVRARIRERVGDHYNARQLSALWCHASGPGGYLDKTDRPVRITGEGSRGNANKSTVYRRWRGWVQ